MKPSKTHHLTGNEKLLAILSILLVAAILAACATPTGTQGLSAGSEKAGNQVQPLSGKEPPEPQMEITAGNQANSNSPVEGGGEEGVVNSQGTVIPPGTPSGQEGLNQIGGSAGEGEPISSKEIDWKTYTDEKYGFSLLYPSTYLILPEGKLDQYTGQKPLHVVRFQDEAIAKMDTANLEPPKFAIEVYERPASLALKDWIQSNRLASSTAAYESVEVPGAQEGLKVSLKTLMAPNVFYYLATEKLIYRIVPLGEYSQEMLASFKLPQ